MSTEILDLIDDARATLSDAREALTSCRLAVDLDCFPTGSRVRFLLASERLMRLAVLINHAFERQEHR